MYFKLKHLFLCAYTSVELILMKGKRTTIQDIANHAKLSVGTIDRVIHNRGKVSPDKKKKVEEAIKQLNFNPNFLARTLALGKQFLICSLLPEDLTHNNYWSLPKKGAKQIANNYRDYGIELNSFEYSLSNESSFTKHAKTIVAKKPDGVILAPIFEAESLMFIKELEEQGIPYVFIDANIPKQKNLS